MIRLGQLSFPSLKWSKIIWPVQDTQVKEGRQLLLQSFSFLLASFFSCFLVAVAFSPYQRLLLLPAANSLCSRFSPPPPFSAVLASGACADSSTPSAIPGLVQSWWPSCCHLQHDSWRSVQLSWKALPSGANLNALWISISNPQYSEFPEEAHAFLMGNICYFPIAIGKRQM